MFPLPLEKSYQICNNKNINIIHGANEMEDLKDLNNPENPCNVRNTTQWGGGL